MPVKDEGIHCMCVTAPTTALPLHSTATADCALSAAQVLPVRIQLSSEGSLPVGQRYPKPRYTLTFHEKP